MSLLAAVCFAILGTPPVLWLERKHIPSAVAVLLVVAGMITIMLGLAAIVRASNQQLLHPVARLSGSGPSSLPFPPCSWPSSTWGSAGP